MAIVKYGNGENTSNLERRVGIKAAKKAAKHPAKKHAEKHAAKHSAKHPGKKSAKHAADPFQHSLEHTPEQAKAGDDLAKAFHHLCRAGAVISLMGQQTGGDLPTLLDLGIAQYHVAAAPASKKHHAKAAQGLLRAAEHLALAALYSARETYLAEVPVPKTGGHAKELKKLRIRLDGVKIRPETAGDQIKLIAAKLLDRTEANTHDMHLEHELIKAVDGLCSALEEGL